MSHQAFLKRAIQLAQQHSQDGQHGPFGAVIVKNGEVIAEGWNQVVASCDPSAHAEVMAIRSACQQLENHSLEGCILYSSCEPCPMCLSASVWARLDKVYYASTRFTAAEAGFDDERLYTALESGATDSVIVCEQLQLAEADQVFLQWNKNITKVMY